MKDVDRTMTLRGLLEGFKVARARDMETGTEADTESDTESVTESDTESEWLNSEVLGIAYDSREVKPGYVFVAIRGMRTDGNRFVDQAAASGAIAVVSVLPPHGPRSSAWIQVEDDRAALAAISSRFYGRPTDKLRLVGVTGTNGKTSTTYLLESILKAAGAPAAVLGTIEYRGPGFAYAADRTTPEAPDLENLFRQVVDAGWKHAVMEVSSHAIALQRVTALHFDVAVFTNLSRDHLDLHGDMRSYFLEKKKLFAGLDGAAPRALVLNMDDPCFDELNEIDPERVISYGVDRAADVRPLRHRFDASGTEAVFQTTAGEFSVRSRLVGRHSLYNMSAAIGAALALNVPLDAIRSGIEGLVSVPGRFESIDEGQSFRVIVDYAHTDDALEKTLVAARELTAGKLIVVFGCGGERDRTKRPVMGAVAGRLSDFAVVTSDNPRSEDPRSITREIEPGFGAADAGAGRYIVLVDRHEAIRHALERARPGDTVVVAGKGHESYQVVGDENLPFDDRQITRELLHELTAGRNH